MLQIICFERWIIIYFVGFKKSSSWMISDGCCCCNEINQYSLCFDFPRRVFSDVVFMRRHHYSQCFDLFFQSILQMSVLCLVMLCLWDVINTPSALIYSFRVSSRWVFNVWWCCVYEMSSILPVLWFILSEYPPDECSMFGDVVFMRCHQYSQCFDLFFQSILQMSVLCLVMLCLWDVINTPSALVMLCLWDVINTPSALIYSFRVSSR